MEFGAGEFGVGVEFSARVEKSVPNVLWEGDAGGIGVGGVINN